MYSGPISAGDDPQNEFSLERADDLSGAGHQAGIFSLVGESPDTVGFIPFCARQPSGAIDAVPVGRIVTSEIVEPPIDAEGLKHREVRARVRAIGIDERAVPVK